MEKTYGLIVLAISEDCKVLLNGIQICDSKTDATGFAPQLLLRQNDTIRQIVEHNFKYNDEVQFSALGCVVIIIIIMGVYQRYKTSQIQSQNKNEQDEKDNVVRQEAMIANVD